MGEAHDRPSHAKVTPGVETPPSINPRRAAPKRSRPSPASPEAYVDGIRAGDRVVLSQAITLVESTRAEHQELAQQIVAACLPHAGASVRIGVTGVPGAGKSTFIERLGTMLTAQAHRLAVLAVDPSSARTGGSILGDKTRMPRLAADPKAYIRPSPAAGSPGGVARRTREAILLCEAAGYEVVLVETVGVGQSETAVHAMVDFFLLLVLAGAGDELQGLKRGIIEMADAIAVTKADGDNTPRARATRDDYRSALRLFPPPPSGWRPRVLTCSAFTGAGMDDVWQTVQDYLAHVKPSGFFEKKRRWQALHGLHQSIEQHLRADFLAHPAVQAVLPTVEAQVLEGRLTPFAAAQQLLAHYHGP